MRLYIIYRKMPLNSISTGLHHWVELKLLNFFKCSSLKSLLNLGQYSIFNQFKKYNVWENSNTLYGFLWIHCCKRHTDKYIKFMPIFLLLRKIVWMLLYPGNSLLLPPVLLIGCLLELLKKLLLQLFSFNILLYTTII